MGSLRFSRLLSRISKRVRESKLLIIRMHSLYFWREKDGLLSGLNGRWAYQNKIGGEADPVFLRRLRQDPLSNPPLSYEGTAGGR